MTLTKRAMLAGLAAAPMALSACTRAQSDTLGTEANPIPVLLDWKAEPLYAGFYIADRQGFYREEGVFTRIVEGNGATSTAQVVAVGNEYVIGSNSGAATVIGRSKGERLKSLAVYYHDTPTVVYSLGRKPIRTPADLVGKRIGAAVGSINNDEFRGLMQANNIDPSSVTIVGVGFDVAPLLSNQVDGLLNYAELTPVQLAVDGQDVVTLRMSDYGVNTYSLNLIANEDAWARNPEVLKKVARATTRAYQLIKDNPDQASEIFLQAFPEKSRAFVQASMRVVAQQLGGDAAVGSQTVDGWQETIQTLDRLGLLQGQVAAADLPVSVA